MTVLRRETVDDDVLRLTLDRPDALNALSTELLREIVTALEDASGEFSVLILRGAGDSFSAGADLDEITQGNEEIELFQEITRQVRAFDGIVIGQLDGWVVGGAFEWSLSFDLRYATPETTFKMTESEIGVTVSNASTQLLPAMIGDGKARELIITSRELNAAEAEDLGLVSGIYPADEIGDRVSDVARDLVENKSTEALALNKRALNAAAPIEETLEYETLAFEHNEALSGSATIDLGDEEPDG